MFLRCFALVSPKKKLPAYLTQCQHVHETTTFSSHYVSSYREVQAVNDQKMAQSERNSHYTRVGKKQKMTFTY